MPTLKYQGCSLFRQRIVASILTCQPLKIENIRSKDEAPGMRNFEANFLLLIDKITDGTYAEFSTTGTTLKFKPGILQGSSAGSSTGTGKIITHDCGTERSIGWFIEGIIPLALFSKTPVEMELTGITNDETDLSVDVIRAVTLPLLQNFGVWGATLEVKRRGCRPLGGGRVILKIPPVRSTLNPLHVTDEGLVKRVRGVAFSAKISPAVVNRVVDACREVLNKVLPDVFINTDTYSGHMAGDSPGYSLSLVAETTTGALLSVERTAAARAPSNSGQGQAQGPGWTAGGLGGAGSGSGGGGAPELPEDVGRQGAMMLLQEIYKGGVVDSMHQSLVLQLMVLTPEDVSKVRFGALTGQAVQVLRLLREAFGVTFKIKQDKHPVVTSSSSSSSLPRGGAGVKGAKRPAPSSGGAGSRGRKRRASEGSEDSSDHSSDSDEEEEEEDGSDSDGEGDGEGSEMEEEEDDGEGYSSGSNSSNSGDSEEEEGEEEDEGLEAVASSSTTTTQERTTVLLSCYGIGYSNVYRRVT